MTTGGGTSDDRWYTLDFQVWRPSPTTIDDSTGSGQYILVGNNRYTSISLTNDIVRVTPRVQNQVQFQPGDVLGLHVEEARDSNRGVNVITRSTYTSETVWHASVPSLYDIGCPISAGSDGVLNTKLRGAPVISIKTGNNVSYLANLLILLLYFLLYIIIQKHTTVLRQRSLMHHALRPLKLIFYQLQLLVPLLPLLDRLHCQLLFHQSSQQIQDLV